MILFIVDYSERVIGPLKLKDFLWLINQMDTKDVMKLFHFHYASRYKSDLLIKISHCS